MMVAMWQGGGELEYDLTQCFRYINQNQLKLTQVDWWS